MLKPLFIVAGCLTAMLGFIGVFLPVLPTTPFLLLSAVCFAKGSNRMREKLINSKIYKKYAEEYLRTGGLTLRKKRNILLFATITISISFFLVKIIHVRIFLVVLLAIMYFYFFFKIKTLPEKNKEESSK